jgi:non-heme chloroperoxidase
MLFFLNRGYRVIAHDRRGHGRSSQTADGHDMDHYADDLATLTAHLDLKNAIHVGHSTGGGEVVHYIARHGESRVAMAALLSAVPPLMMKTASNPGGLPKDVFDGWQAQLAANRSVFYRALPEGPFYGFNRPGVKASEAIIANWWRQGMMGARKRITTASSPSRRLISPRTSRRSPCRCWLCTAMTIRSYPMRIPGR